MKLLIIEGSGKIAQLKKILPNDFKIMATAGHLRQLSTTTHNGYGFDFQNFNPDWDFIPAQNGFPSKSKIATEINNAAAQADTIYIAGDPDREGEAISWHINEILKPQFRSKVKRIAFAEITKSAIDKAIQEPQGFYYDLINAQFARAMIDKLFGYKASKLVQNKINARSAGRVQSMVIRLIEEREREIENYVELKKYSLKPVLTGNLKSSEKQIKENEKYEDVYYDSLPIAQENKKTLISSYVVNKILPDIKHFQATPLPYETAGALIMGENKFNLSAARMTKVLQELYENGITTYPRTDSSKLLPEKIEAIKAQIEKEFGINDFDPSSMSKLAPTGDSKDKNEGQGGHQALSPVDISITEEDGKFTDLAKTIGDISHHKKVYKMIRAKTLASCMKPAEFSITEVFLTNANKTFQATSKVLIYAGFLKCFGEDESNNENNDDISTTDFKVKIGDSLQVLNDDFIKEHINKKPQRYTEATLIKKLKQKEIGRPSTYRMMVEINTKINNVELAQKKFLKPTPLGRSVASFVINNLNSVVNENYSKNMEKDLDKIAIGKLEYKKDFLIPFYDSLMQVLGSADNISKIEKFKQETQEVCPLCKSKLILKESKGRKYFTCETANYNFKTKQNTGCKFFAWERDGKPEVSTPKAPTVLTNIECPLCKSKMVQRKGPKGDFYGCSQYPKCKGVKQLEK